jgi:hypothetical protein
MAASLTAPRFRLVPFLSTRSVGVASAFRTGHYEGMAKKAQKMTTNPAQKLGRSAVTGKYVLAPAAKKGGKASISKVREVTRDVLSGKKA